MGGRGLRRLRLAAFGGTLLFVLGLNTHGHFGGSGDEPHYQMIAHSLVFDGDLDVRNNYADPRNLVGAGTLEPESHAIDGVGGALRPVHDVGLPLVAAPFFAAAYWVAERSGEAVPPALMRRARLTEPLVLRHLLSVGMAALTGVLAVLLFEIGRRTGLPARAALFWAVLLTVSPPLLSHAFLFFTELPAAVLVALFWLALDPARRLTPARHALLGAAAGFLLILHARNAGLVAGLAGLVLWRTFRDGRLHAALAFAGPLAAFVAFRTWINLRFWGSWVTSPHTVPAGAAESPVHEILVRLFGLLLDQEHGLLVYAPIYLLVLPGWVLMKRAGGDERRVAALLLFAYLLPVLLPWVNRHGWSGGWSPAARFLVPIAPLLIVIVFHGVRQVSRWPAWMTALVIVQAGLNLLYWSRPKLLWNDGTGASALARQLSPGGLDLPAWLPSWHAPTPWTWAVTLAVLGLWWLLALRLARSPA